MLAMPSVRELMLSITRENDTFCSHLSMLCGDKHSGFTEPHLSQTTPCEPLFQVTRNKEVTETARISVTKPLLIVLSV